MAANGFKAIPTVYRGVQMRSRLEAKWAAFFDLLGWRWEYEPFDCDGWIPDFLLTGAKVLVEIKPATEIPEETIRELDEKIPADFECLIGGATFPEHSWWGGVYHREYGAPSRPHPTIYIEPDYGVPIGWMLGRPAPWRPDVDCSWGYGMVGHFKLIHPKGFENFSNYSGLGLYHSNDPEFRVDPGCNWRESHEDNPNRAFDRFFPARKLCKAGGRRPALTSFWSQAANRSQWKGIQSVT